MRSVPSIDYAGDDYSLAGPAYFFKMLTSHSVEHKDEELEEEKLEEEEYVQDPRAPKLADEIEEQNEDAIALDVTSNDNDSDGVAFSKADSRCFIEVDVYAVEREEEGISPSASNIAKTKEEEERGAAKISIALEPTSSWCESDVSFMIGRALFYGMDACSVEQEEEPICPKETTTNALREQEIQVSSSLVCSITNCYTTSTTGSELDVYAVEQEEEPTSSTEYLTRAQYRWKELGAMMAPTVSDLSTPLSRIGSTRFPQTDVYFVEGENDFASLPQQIMFRTEAKHETDAPKSLHSTLSEDWGNVFSNERSPCSSEAHVGTVEEEEEEQPTVGQRKETTETQGDHQYKTVMTFDLEAVASYGSDRVSITESSAHSPEIEVCPVDLGENNAVTSPCQSIDTTTTADDNDEDTSVTGVTTLHSTNVVSAAESEENLVSPSKETTEYQENTEATAATSDPTSDATSNYHDVAVIHSKGSPCSPKTKACSTVDYDEEEEDVWPSSPHQVQDVFDEAEGQSEATDEIATDSDRDTDVLVEKNEEDIGPLEDHTDVQDEGIGHDFSEVDESKPIALKQVEIFDACDKSACKSPYSGRLAPKKLKIAVQRLVKSMKQPTPIYTNSDWWVFESESGTEEGPVQSAGSANADCTADHSVKEEQEESNKCCVPLDKDKNGPEQDSDTVAETSSDSSVSGWRGDPTVYHSTSLTDEANNLSRFIDVDGVPSEGSHQVESAAVGGRELESSRVLNRHHESEGRVDVMAQAQVKAPRAKVSFASELDTVIDIAEVGGWDKKTNVGRYLEQETMAKPTRRRRRRRTPHCSSHGKIDDNNFDLDSPSETSSESSDDVGGVNADIFSDRAPSSGFSSYTSRNGKYVRTQRKRSRHRPIKKSGSIGSITSQEAYTDTDFDPAYRTEDDTFLRDHDEFMKEGPIDRFLDFLFCVPSTVSALHDDDGI